MVLSRVVSGYLIARTHWVSVRPRAVAVDHRSNSSRTASSTLSRLFQMSVDPPAATAMSPGRALAIWHLPHLALSLRPFLLKACLIHSATRVPLAPLVRLCLAAPAPLSPVVRSLHSAWALRPLAAIRPSTTKSSPSIPSPKRRYRQHLYLTWKRLVLLEELILCLISYLFSFLLLLPIHPTSMHTTATYI
jgi:hypothetical protein